MPRTGYLAHPALAEERGHFIGAETGAGSQSQVAGMIAVSVMRAGLVLQHGLVVTDCDRGPGFQVTRSSSAHRRPQESDNGVNDPLECVRRQHGELAGDEVLTGGEQLAWASVAHHPERAGRERSVIHFDRSRVAVWLARDLSEDLIAATGVGKHDRGTQLGLGEIGERESDQDHCAYWR